MITNKSQIIAHPWHGISAELEGCRINAIVEISKGMKSKYEIDKDYGLIKLDRVLRTSFQYPVNYGFIPQSLGDDGDPLDILILSQVDIVPLCLVRAKVIGVMHMDDRGKKDDKIIAVANFDPSVNFMESIRDLPDFWTAELKHFFEQYTVLENKKVIVDEFDDKEIALVIIEEALQLYRTL
jgi:inorganic pyrophosphatase